MSWMYAAWQGIKQVGKAAMADPGTAGGGGKKAAGYGGSGMTEGGEMIVDGTEGGTEVEGGGLGEALGGALSAAGDGNALGIGKSLAGGDPKAITQQLLGGGKSKPEPTGEKAAAGKQKSNTAKSQANIQKQGKVDDLEKEKQMNDIYGKQNEFGSKKKRKGALS